MCVSASERNKNEIIGNFSRNIATLELNTTQEPVRAVGNTVQIYILLNISDF